MVKLAVPDSKRFYFYQGFQEYGYIDFWTYSYGEEVSAPYGIYVSSSELDTAPLDTGQYTRAGVPLEYGNYYYFRPDESHYGELFLCDLEESDDSVTITIEWYFQTDSTRRDFR